ncbi:MAG: fimbrial protein [Enterobacteriaceae bacterium]|jgi:type 1 fimbria pilin|nr:fimbrial protein [Enterobacteriaceae bacterium]
MLNTLKLSTLKLSTLGAVAALVLGGISAAYADGDKAGGAAAATKPGRDAKILIHGKVLNTTCLLSTNVNNLDLKSWLPDDFKGNDLVESKKDFILNVSNCRKTATKDTVSPDSVKIQVSGPQQAESLAWGQNENDDDPNSEGLSKNVGIKLTANGDEVKAENDAQFAIAGKNVDTNKKEAIVPMAAWLVKSADAAVPGDVKADLVFSMTTD